MAEITEAGMDKDPYSCHNCKDLMHRLAECEICTGTLQNTGIVTCLCCGEFWCRTCDIRLNKCPFCRSTSRGKCQVLEKLVKNLTLPCQNNRFGCNAMCNTENREIHAATCKFGLFHCPKSECPTKLRIKDIPGHLQTEHKFVTVNSKMIDIKIKDIYDRFSKTCMTRNYHNIAMITPTSTFMIQLSFFNYRLRVDITQKDFKIEAILQRREIKRIYHNIQLQFCNNIARQKDYMLLNSRDNHKHSVYKFRRGKLPLVDGEYFHIIVAVNSIDTEPGYDIDLEISKLK